MKRLRILAALFLALGGHAPAGAAEREVFAITGVFKYERGDVIQYKCGMRLCRETLVRDRYLQEHGAELFGKEITIRVTRINACRDPRSTGYACATRVNDTALLIVEWLRPRR